MSKFTVDKNTFGQLLKLCELPNKIKEQELSLTVTPTGISGSVHFNRSLFINAAITGKYEDWGEVGVNNIPLLVQFILAGSTGEKITMSKTANQLHCEFDGTEFISTLRDAKYVTNKPDQKKMQEFIESTVGGPTLKLSSVDIKRVLDYGRVINAQSVGLNVKETTIILEFNGAKESCKVTFPITGVKTPFKFSFGELFLKLLDNLKEHNLIIALNPQHKLGYVKIDSKDINFESLIVGLA